MDEFSTSTVSCAFTGEEPRVAGAAAAARLQHALQCGVHDVHSAGHVLRHAHEHAVQVQFRPRVPGVLHLRNVCPHSGELLINVI